MQAAQINEYGGAEKVGLNTEATKPTVKAGEVLVEVHAAGVNPFDRKVREGQARGTVELSFPATLGGDFAGVVAEVGEGVTTVAVGDEVYGQAGPLSSHGSFAEFAPVKAGALARKPATLNFVQAAAAPLAAVSAYQALVEHLSLQPGQKILIHGGDVATTASDEGLDLVKQLGADEIIDYKTQNFTSLLKDFDAVFDTVGGDTYRRSFRVLKPGGAIVSMVEQPDEALAKERNIATTVQFTRVTTENLEKVAELLDSGALTVHVDRTFPLAEAGEAQEYLYNGQHLGKVVLIIK
jgi:alcohol dehydrogenase